MNKIAKAVLAFLLLLLGVFALLVTVVSGVPYWRAQRAIAQRKAELAAAKPLKVNPGSLVGTWYGKGGPNREFALTLTITSDNRMGSALNPGDPGEEVERQMLSPYSTVATLGIDGLASNGCSYESLSLNGNASGNTVQLTGYKGSVGDTPNPRLDGSLWQDTDSFQFSARLSATGMSGLLSTASNRPGCRPMIIPFDLSLVEVPAGHPAYVAPPAVPAPETNKRNGPSVAEQPTSSTAQPSQRSDAQIETDAVHALDSLKALKNDLITVTTIQGEVTLSGTVSSDASRELAEWTVSHVPGVTTVHNNLRLRQDDRSIPQ